MFALPVSTRMNGPLLITVGGARGVALLAVRFGQPPHSLISRLPAGTAVGPSPRGRYLALAEDSRGLWLAKGDGAGLYRRLAPPPSSSPRTHQLEITDVAWSPDRYTLAYAVTERLSPRNEPGLQPFESDPHGGVWTVRYDGGAPRQVATFAQLGYYIDGLSWSSDGNRIAVNHETTLGLIDVVNHRVTAGLISGQGAVSPTDPVVAYTPTSENTRAPANCPTKGSGPPIVFCTVDLQRRHAREVGQDMTTQGGPVSGLVWSPDGRNLSYLWQGNRSSQRVEIHTLGTRK